MPKTSKTLRSTLTAREKVNVHLSPANPTQALRGAEIAQLKQTAQGNRYAAPLPSYVFFSFIYFLQWECSTESLSSHSYSCPAAQPSMPGGFQPLPSWKNAASGSSVLSLSKTTRCLQPRDDVSHKALETQVPRLQIPPRERRCLKHGEKERTRRRAGAGGRTHPPVSLVLPP